MNNLINKTIHKSTLVWDFGPNTFSNQIDFMIWKL